MSNDHRERRSKLLWILIPLALMFLLAASIFALWLEFAAVIDRGSPELAGEWRADLETYATPEDASQADPTIQIVKFENGDWVMGRAQNSHGFWHRGGGTMVIKDSRGKIQAFAGHVCGPNFLSFAQKPSLDAFYKYLEDCEFVELDFQ